MAHASERGAGPITFERVYDASIEDVWALWTTKEGLEAWFAPEGMRVEITALHLRVGGAFDYVMSAVGAEQIAYLANLDKRQTARVSGQFVEMVRVVAPQLSDAITTVVSFARDAMNSRGER